MKTRNQTMFNVYHNRTNVFYQHIPVRSLKSNPFYQKNIIKLPQLEAEQTIQEKKYLQNRTTRNNLPSQNMEEEAENVLKSEENKSNNTKKSNCHDQFYKLRKTDTLGDIMLHKYLKTPKTTTTSTQSTINLGESVKSNSSIISETSSGFFPRLKSSKVLPSLISTDIYLKLLGRTNFQYLREHRHERNIDKIGLSFSQSQVRIDEILETDKHVEIVDLQIPLNISKKEETINSQNDIKHKKNMRVKLNSSVFELFR